MFVKKIVLGILLYVLVSDKIVKLMNIKKKWTCVKVITDDLVLVCDEILDAPETVLSNSNDKKPTYKMKYF